MFRISVPGFNNPLGVTTGIIGLSGLPGLRFELPKLERRCEVELSPAMAC